MRNFVSQEESPFIYPSTYDCHQLIDKEISYEEKVILGYNSQAKAVTDSLAEVLRYYYSQGDWVIVEGVHLTPSFIIDMMKELKYCFGFLVHINDKSKHLERFAIRSKKMSQDPKENKYVKNIDVIGLIQGYLISEADRLHIPKLNNKNLDSSIGQVHRAFLRTFRIHKKKKTLLNRDNTAAEYFLEEFEQIKQKMHKNKDQKNSINMTYKNMSFEGQNNTPQNPEKKQVFSIKTL